MRRSMDWTLEDNMVDGLFFCATLTSRRRGHTHLWYQDYSHLDNCHPRGVVGRERLATAFTHFWGVGTNSRFFHVAFEVQGK